MKCLIFGCNGMAGHVVARKMSPRFDVIGVARSVIDDYETITADLTNYRFSENLVKKVSPSIVINCAGVLNAQASSNFHDAFSINSYLPNILSYQCQVQGAKFITLSTDCIFSGDRGPYTFDSIPSGTSDYAITKFVGEVYNNTSTTVRTSIVGPDMNSNGIGLFNWFSKQKNAEGYSNAFWSGVTTIELASFILHVTESQDYQGKLIQLSNGYSISKFDLLKLFNTHVFGDKVELIENGEYSVNKVLIPSNCPLDYKLKSYSDMILEMKEWIELYSELYPHYSVQK